MYRKNKRNYGHGRQIFYAGKLVISQAAREQGGRFGWHSATVYRWKAFSRFCKSIGIIDSRMVTIDTVIEYRNQLTGNVSTIQNYLSAINVVMRLLTNEEWKPFSPAKIAGKRRSAVRVKPVVISYSTVYEIHDDLMSSGIERLAFIPVFCFLLGTRRREAALLDLNQALVESKTKYQVDIVRGSKGGRSKSIERLIPTTPELNRFLENAIACIGNDRCLVPSNMTYIEFSNSISNKILPVLKKYGVEKLHDLRATYACRRYFELTGCVAPVNAKPGCSQPDKELDHHARKLISEELGHFRPQILISYVGSWSTFNCA